MQIAAHPLLGISRDYDALMELVGDAPVVLLGEASHGSHEFYQACQRYVCFAHFGESSQAYGYAVSFGTGPKPRRA